MSAVEEQDSILEKAQRVVIALWVCLLVLMLSRYTADPSTPIKQLITSFTALVLALLCLVGLLLGRQRFRIATRTTLVLALFLGVNCIAAVMSEHRGHGLATVREWTEFALIALVASQVFRRPEHIWRLLTVIVLAVTLSSVYGFAQWMGVDPFPWSLMNVEEYHGLPSTYANPNFAGHVLVMALIMALGLAFRERKRLNLLFLVPLALMGAHLYLTHMRGGRVALLTVAVVFIVARSGAPNRSVSSKWSTDRRQCSGDFRPACSSDTPRKKAARPKASCASDKGAHRSSARVAKSSAVVKWLLNAAKSGAVMPGKARFMCACARLTSVLG